MLIGNSITMWVCEEEWICQEGICRLLDFNCRNSARKWSLIWCLCVNWISTEDLWAVQFRSWMGHLPNNQSKNPHINGLIPRTHRISQGYRREGPHIKTIRTPTLKILPDQAFSEQKTSKKSTRRWKNRPYSALKYHWIVLAHHQKLSKTKGSD